jgi:hypothetical protein
MTEIELRLDTRVEAAEPETITTPAGEFSDVVGVVVSIPRAEFLAQPGEVDWTFGEGLLPTVTTWYARGVGPVRIDTEDPVFQESAELTGCTG